MRVVVGLLVVLLSTPALAGAPTAVPVGQGSLPRTVRATGSLDAAWTYGDRNGLNYVLFSSQHGTGGPGPDGSPSPNAWLYVDHWVVPATGKPRLVRTVRQQVEDCGMGQLTAQFHGDAFGVTDLDADGLAEITLAYEYGCRSDVRSNDLKLLVLENGAKYILRGTTRIEGHTGGDYDPDPAAARWPAKFLAHAKDVWDATADDASIPPGAADANPCGN